MSLNNLTATMVAERYKTSLRPSNEILQLEEMEINYLMDLMEQMAGAPREEHGKRQPGERCMYEIQRREFAENMGSVPRDTERLSVQ